jgi:hypothetical protein
MYRQLALRRARARGQDQSRSPVLLLFKVRGAILLILMARPERLLAGCARSSLAHARDRPRRRTGVQPGSQTRPVVELPRRLRRRSGVLIRYTGGESVPDSNLLE